MLDCIDGYIAHMQLCYRELDLSKAFALTIDFFENIVNEVYVKSVKKRIIAFPNAEENREHFRVIRRIMELVAVVNPLFPFSAFHVARRGLMKWPEISN